jgi:hypothetical protein
MPVRNVIQWLDETFESLNGTVLILNYRFIMMTVQQRDFSLFRL